MPLGGMTCPVCGLAALPVSPAIPSQIAESVVLPETCDSRGATEPTRHAQAKPALRERLAQPVKNPFTGSSPTETFLGLAVIAFVLMIVWGVGALAVNAVTGHNSAPAQPVQADTMECKIYNQAKAQYDPTDPKLTSEQLRLQLIALDVMKRGCEGSPAQP
jgi:hypothetical protein